MPQSATFCRTNRFECDGIERPTAGLFFHPACQNVPFRAIPTIGRPVPRSPNQPQGYDRFRGSQIGGGVTNFREVTALGNAIDPGTVPDCPSAVDAGEPLNTAAKAFGEFGYEAMRASQGAPLARAMGAGELVWRLRAEMERALAVVTMRS